MEADRFDKFLQENRGMGNQGKKALELNLTRSNKKPRLRTPVYDDFLNDEDERKSFKKSEKINNDFQNKSLSRETSTSESEDESINEVESDYEYEPEKIDSFNINRRNSNPFNENRKEYNLNTYIRTTPPLSKKLKTPVAQDIDLMNKSFEKDSKSINNLPYSKNLRVNSRVSLPKINKISYVKSDKVLPNIGLYQPKNKIEIKNVISDKLLKNIIENQIEEIELPVFIKGSEELGKVIFSDPSEIVWQNGNKNIKFKATSDIKRWFINEELIEEKIKENFLEHYTINDYNNGKIISFTILNKDEIYEIYGNISINRIDKNIILLNILQGKFNGVQKKYVNQKLIIECNFINGILNGKYKEFREDGSKKVVAQYIDGHLEGKCLYFYRSGILKRILHFKNGKLNGKAREYYDDPSLLNEERKQGKIIHHQKNRKKTVNYCNGKLEGKFKYYSSNGTVIKNGYFNCGRYHGMYYEFYDSKDPKLIAFFNEGLLHGPVEKYSDDGSKELIYYFHGKKIDI